MKKPMEYCYNALYEPTFGDTPRAYILIPLGDYSGYYSDTVYSSLIIHSHTTRTPNHCYKDPDNGNYHLHLNGSPEPFLMFASDFEDFKKTINKYNEKPCFSLKENNKDLDSFRNWVHNNYSAKSERSIIRNAIEQYETENHRQVYFYGA